MMYRQLKVLLPALICSVLTVSCTADEKPAPASAPTQESAASNDVIRIDFSQAKPGKKGIPEGWTYKGKFGTPGVKYELTGDAALRTKVLRIVSEKGTGVILRDLKDIDLNQYPIMRWKWQAEKLPAGADARKKEVDDQGIAIYIGYGKFKQTSVSYTWQTETPKGDTGKAVYNGLVTVYWFGLRDKHDGEGKWVVEERNVRNDIMKEFGTDELPDNLALTISSNSQYTGTTAVSRIAWIEFARETSRQ